MNVFSAIGNVGKDAEVRHTASGNSVAGWSLAVNSGWGDNKQTIWIDCSMWGERGAKVAQYITKGIQLGVTGELGTREYDGKTYVTLNVRDVTLPRKQDGGQSEPRQQRQQPAAQPEPMADDFTDDIPFMRLPSWPFL